jgi:hypothetical protein
MATLTRHVGKDFLEASHQHAQETVLGYSTGAEVSPMKWDGEYYFAITTPEPETPPCEDCGYRKCRCRLILPAPEPV